jgi:hypothetical protein
VGLPAVALGAGVPDCLRFRRGRALRSALRVRVASGGGLPPRRCACTGACALVCAASALAVAAAARRTARRIPGSSLLVGFLLTVTKVTNSPKLAQSVICRERLIMRALQFATATANLACQNAFLFLATHGPIFIASSSSATPSGDSSFSKARTPSPQPLPQSTEILS